MGLGRRRLFARLQRRRSWKNTVSTASIARHYDWAGVFSGTFGGWDDAPRDPSSSGGVVRETTRFGLGTDIGIMARATTGGFSRGDWGWPSTWARRCAGGGYGEYGRYPLQGVLTAGAPWGIQIAVGADIVNLYGQPPTRGGFALLEIDVLRLTLMRQGSTDKAWKNPSPAGGRIRTLNPCGVTFAYSTRGVSIFRLRFVGADRVAARARAQHLIALHVPHGALPDPRRGSGRRGEFAPKVPLPARMSPTIDRRSSLIRLRYPITSCVWSSP